MHILEKKLEAALRFIHFLLSFTLIFPVLIFRRASCGRKWTSVTMRYGPALLGWNSGGVSSPPCTPAPLPILCSVPPSPGTVGQPGWTLPPTLPISLPACFSPSKWGVISEIFLPIFLFVFWEIRLSQKNRLRDEFHSLAAVLPSAPVCPTFDWYLLKFLVFQWFISSADVCLFPFLHFLNRFWLDQKGKNCVSTHASIFTWNSQSRTAVKPDPGECLRQREEPTQRHRDERAGHTEETAGSWAELEGKAAVIEEMCP